MKGFTLLEILLVIVLIGILAAFCLPSYKTHLQHERRLDAEITLVKLASALEEYRIANNTYRNASLDELGFPEKIAGGNYLLVIASLTDSQFLLQAIPIKKDDKCAVLSLNASGEKDTSGTGKMSDCWV